jgi:hypothetical protein
MPSWWLAGSSSGFDFAPSHFTVDLEGIFWHCGFRSRNPSLWDGTHFESDLELSRFVPGCCGWSLRNRWAASGLMLLSRLDWARRFSAGTEASHSIASARAAVNHWSNPVIISLRTPILLLVIVGCVRHSGSTTLQTEGHGNLIFDIRGKNRRPQPHRMRQRFPLVFGKRGRRFYQCSLGKKLA